MMACLNEQGMKEFGDVVPDGLVPVLHIHPVIGVLGDIGVRKIYMVNLPLLKTVDPEAYQRSINKLVKKFNKTTEEMEAYFEENRMPLRAELVSSVEIDARFVI